MASLIKWVLWLVIMVSGHPNQMKMWSYKNFVVTTIVLVCKAFASTHLVAKSMATKIYQLLK
jgi:hypothetical protein